MSDERRTLWITDLERKLTSRQIKRRDFLAGAMAAGLSLPIASLLADQVNAATPKKGGLLRWGSGQGSTTDTLDPGKFENLFQINSGYAFRGHLTELSSTGELIGDLAESWEASDDAATWIFKLRKGVEFHNGKTLDSGDVVATLNHHRGEDSKSAAKALLAAVKDVKADDANTVTVTLTGGNADFPTILTDYHLAVMPSDGKGGVDWASGVGTGGYQMMSFEPGVRMKMKRFPNYWKEGMAHFDEIEALVITDVVARTSALTSGSVDVIDRCDLKTVHLLKNNPNIEVDEVPSAAHCAIPMMTNKAPFDNNDVRLALKYAMDRQAILDKVLNGHGVVGNDHPIGSSLKFFAKDLPQRAYDPDKAKFHLKKAGLDGLKVKLHSADAAFAGAVDTAILFQASAKSAGIDMEVVKQPSDGYWSNIWLKEPFMVSNWGARPTQDMMFSTVYASGAPWNETFWGHERFNKLLVEARSELDQTKRNDMYVEMQTICHNEGGAIIPFFKNYVYAHSKKVQHGPNLGATWGLDGAKAMERWWFA